MQEKESEFKNAITLQVPDAPDFKDNMKDAPLTNVSETIQRMIAERNFEIDTISKAHDKKKAEQWLSSSKTSIQDEKGGQGGQGGQGGEPLGATSRRMIKIDTADLSMDVPSISLGDPPKQVTWGQNSSIDVNVAPTSLSQTESATETKTDTGSDSFVFSKLKRVRDDAPPSPETMVEPAGGDDAMDVRRLYEYVTERFDRMERLLAERLNEKLVCVCNAITRTFCTSNQSPNPIRLLDTQDHQQYVKGGYQCRRKTHTDFSTCVCYRDVSRATIRVR